MDEQLARVIGARVRAARAASRRTQVVVAGLTGITTDYLHQIERGKKLPTISVLTQLAQVLDVPLSRLLDQPQSRAGDQPVMTDAGAALYRALTQPVTLTQPVPSDGPPSVSELHERVRSAWRTWQGSPYRYSTLRSRLPVLVADAELAERRYRGVERVGLSID